MRTRTNEQSIKNQLRAQLSRVAASADRTENPYPQHMVVAVQSLSADVSALAALRASKDPSHTDDQHVILTHKQADRIREQLTAKTIAVMKAHQQGAADLASQIREACNLKPNTRYEAHVLSKFQSLKTHAEQSEYLLALANEGRTQALASLIDAGFEVTGWSPAQMGVYRDIVVSKLAPDLLNQQDILAEAFAGANAVLTNASNLVNEQADPLEIRDIERRADAARKAREGVNGASLGAEAS